MFTCTFPGRYRSKRNAADNWQAMGSASNELVGDKAAKKKIQLSHLIQACFVLVEINWLQTGKKQSSHVRAHLLRILSKFNQASILGSLVKADVSKCDQATN